MSETIDDEYLSWTRTLKHNPVRDHDPSDEEYNQMFLDGE